MINCTAVNWKMYYESSNQFFITFCYSYTTKLISNTHVWEKYASLFITTLSEICFSFFNLNVVVIFHLFSRVEKAMEFYCSEVKTSQNIALILAFVERTYLYYFHSNPSK